jgi:hydroxypyruvate isomerase
MQRRHFLAATTAACLAPITPLSAQDKPAVKKFKLRYGPHFGMFRESGGKDLVDQLKFAADQGFTAWEDNEMKSRPFDVQKQIAEAMQRLRMEMGVISALRGVWNKVNFTGSESGPREEILASMKSIVEVAKRVNTKYLTVVPGLLDPKLPEEYQFANCIDLLRQCCDIVEPHGLIMVLEALNTKRNHPGVYLTRSPQAFAICRAVNRPSCKILFDMYHQQITDGNLIGNIDHCWPEIAYMQSGDNPGRNEPGTGEVNYRNVFRHLQEKGYQGIIGMEHGNSRKGVEGEQAVIEAYRSADPA